MVVVKEEVCSGSTQRPPEVRAEIRTVPGGRWKGKHWCEVWGRATEKPVVSLSP